MNEGMIAAWNLKVGYDDTVYHLGDFAMGSSRYWESTRKRLNGKIILVRGNHDNVKKLKDFIEEIHDELYLEHNGITYWMSHYPLNDQRRGKPKKVCYRLCGHIHEKWLIKDNCFNVGCDLAPNYAPRHISEIEEICKQNLSYE
jgi:calcineurin-like phosphoesterase family protein